MGKAMVVILVIAGLVFILIGVMDYDNYNLDIKYSIAVIDAALLQLIYTKIFIGIFCIAMGIGVWIIAEINEKIGQSFGSDVDRSEPEIKNSFNTSTDAINIPSQRVSTNETQMLKNNMPQDYSKYFYLNWPIQPVSLDLKLEHKGTSVIASNFELRNVTKYEIKYSEWEFIVYDILSRPINQDNPHIIKIEQDLLGDDSIVFIKDILLPLDTKTVKIRLLNILFSNGQRLNLEKYQPTLVPNKLDQITDYLKTNYKFNMYLENQLQFKRTPEFIHYQTAEGHWTCSFCGVINESKRQQCQLCESLVEQMKLLTEKEIVDLYAKWKISQRMD